MAFSLKLLRCRDRALPPLAADNTHTYYTHSRVRDATPGCSLCVLQWRRKRGCPGCWRTRKILLVGGRTSRCACTTARKFRCVAKLRQPAFPFTRALPVFSGVHAHFKYSAHGKYSCALSLASQTLTQERRSGELPIVELFYCTQNRVVKECNNEVFVFITEWSYATQSRYRSAHTAVCYIRPLSYKNIHLVIAFLDHPVLGAVEQLYYRQFTRPSLMREGLACETNVH